MPPLVVVTALALLDWKGRHHRQVLGERCLLEPAPPHMLYFILDVGISVVNGIVAILL